jgi:competence protein ComGC
MSEGFGRILFQVQEQAISGPLARGGSSAAQSKWMQSLFHTRPAFAYSVGVNTPQGCLTVGNSSQSFANMALLPVVAVPAMLSAIAIPNFVKARSTAQLNSCINNLRMIDAAKQQWVLEKNKTAADVPTKEDIQPYLYKWPVCPQGGTYTIGPVSEPPTCSIPGHKLP